MTQLIAFIGLVLLAVPIAFALLAAAVIALVTSAREPLLIVPEQLIAGMDSFPMLAVPLFIFAGFIMDTGGLARPLIELARTLVGALPGGLGQVSVVSTVLFSSMSGSTSADAAAMGGTLIPQLTRHGYSRARATAIVAAACVAAVMIPPNVAFVIYAVVANVSIGQLFLAGIIPGLVSAAALMVLIAWQARREGWERGSHPTARGLVRSLRSAALPLSLVALVLGGIRYGLYTPTEAAGMAVVYSLALAGLVYRTLTWPVLADALKRTAILTGTILLIVGAARCLTWVLAAEQVPQRLTEAVVGFGGGRTGFLLLTVLVFVPLGTILEGVPAIVLLTPILAPIARQLGIDMVHYGVLIVATQGLSVFLPPIGISLLVTCSVGGVTPREVARPLIGYLALLLAVTLLIAFAPSVSLALPRWAGYR